MHTGIVEVLVIERTHRQCTIEKGDGDAVGQAMIGGLSTLGMPLFGIFPDDVDGCIKARDFHVLDACTVDPRAKAQSRVDGALRVVFDRI